MKSPNFYRLRELIFSLISKDIKPKFNNCDVLFICHEVDKAELIDGKYYSKLLDTISDSLEKNYKISCLTLIKPYSKIGQKNYYGNVFSINRKYELFRITDKLFGTKLLEKYFYMMLNKIKPKIVIGILAHTDIIKCCKKLTIPYIEMLHGYGYTEDNIYYKGLTTDYVPEFFFSLDEFSSKNIERVHKESKVITVESIWHKMLPVYENKRSDKFSILYTTQWGYDKDIDAEFGVTIDNGVIPDRIVSAIESTQDIYHWKIRAHPVQMNLTKYIKHIKFLKNLQSKFINVDFIDASRMKLPELLQQTDFHITMSSSTAYECAMYGIPTITLDPNMFSSDTFSDLEQRSLLLKSNFKTFEIDEIDQLKNKDFESDSKSFVNPVEFIMENFFYDRM